MHAPRGPFAATAENAFGQFAVLPVPSCPLRTVSYRCITERPTETLIMRSASEKVDSNRHYKLQEERDSFGNTKLIKAAKSGDVSELETLIESGADQDALSHNGMTAIHWAAIKGHASIVEALLATGADKDVASHVGIDRSIDDFL